MIRRLLILLVCLFWVPTLHAWYFATHRISSQITWNELAPDVKTEVARLLRAHPRYAEDFEQQMPDNVRREYEEESHAWFLQQASVWPDIVRDLSEGNKRAQYNRSKWHYVNWPLFLSETEKNKLKDSIAINLESDPALAADPKDMNIFQAINYNASILKDRSALDAERAIALCWIAHLVQDIHQPLHTTALFTTGRFSTGDRGGTLIPVSGQGRIKNLHAFWDSMVSESQSSKIIRQRAAFLTKRYRQIGLDAIEAMSIEAWVKENNQLILRYVYTPALRDEIKIREGTGEQLQSIRVTQSYRDQAQAIAEIRVVEASFRLAHLLNQLPTN